MHIWMLASTPQPPQEGIGFYVWNLSQRLVSLGHQVQIVTRSRSARSSRQEVAGVAIWYIGFLPVYPWHAHLHGRRVDRLLQCYDEQIDLIHVHTPLVKCPRTRHPLLVTVHTPMKADVASIPASSSLGALARLQGKVSYTLEKQLFSRATKLTCVAHSVAEELTAYGIDPELVTVTGNGTDTALFSPRSLDCAQGQRPYLLTVSRLAPRKGLFDLLCCAEIVVSRHPEIRFLIAGSGPLEGQLKREINRRHLGQHLQLLGHVANRSSLAALYRGAAAYIHPAHYEGLPTALLEAMSCACPTIATSVGGSPELVAHRRNGLLVPPRDPELLAAAALELLRRPTFGRRLGAAARETVETDFSWQAITDRYLSLYQGVL